MTKPEIQSQLGLDEFEIVCALAGGTHEPEDIIDIAEARNSSDQYHYSVSSSTDAGDTLTYFVEIRRENGMFDPQDDGFEDGDTLWFPVYVVLPNGSYHYPG